MTCKSVVSREHEHRNAAEFAWSSKVNETFLSRFPGLFYIRDNLALAEDGLAVETRDSVIAVTHRKIFSEETWKAVTVSILRLHKNVRSGENAGERGTVNKFRDAAGHFHLSRQRPAGDKEKTRGK